MHQTEYMSDFLYMQPDHNVLLNNMKLEPQFIIP